MPYSGPGDDSLPENIQKLPEDERKQWIEIFNSVLSECMDEGGEDCEAQAFRQANGAVLNAENRLHCVINRISQVRRETKGGTEYLVAPMVAVKPGVMNDELLTEKEIRATTQAWNGRPFTIDHPQDASGWPITANDPDVMAANVVGYLFNAEWDDKLKTEAWIDVRKAQRVEGGPELIRRLQANDPVDVSTGYFRDVEHSEGRYEGSTYKAVAHDLVPDHVAALLNERGACSWQDGCGIPRMNREEAMNVTGDGEQEEVLGLLQMIANKLGIGKEHRMGRMIERILDDGRLKLNREALEEMSECALQGLVESLDALDEETETEEEETEVTGNETDNGENPEDEKAVTLDREEVGEFLDEMFAEVGGAEAAVDLLSSIKTNADGEKEDLVSALATNERCPLSEDALQTLDMDSLRALERSSRSASYTARGGGPQTNEGDEDSIDVLETKPVLSAKKEE